MNAMLNRALISGIIVISFIVSGCAPTPAAAPTATATAAAPTATLTTIPTATATPTVPATAEAAITPSCAGWSVHSTSLGVSHPFVSLNGVEGEGEDSREISEISILRGNDMTVVIDPDSKTIWATSAQTIWADCHGTFVTVTNETVFVRIEETNGISKIRWIFYEYDAAVTATSSATAP